MKMIVKAKPDLETTNVPKNVILRKFHWFVTTTVFETFIMICIVANMLQMAVGYEGSSPTYDQVLQVLNLIFSGIFFIEAVLKLIAFKLSYFKSGWNCFDFLVVFFSILDILMTQFASGLSFLRVGPQLARIMRVLRVSRLLRLINKMDGLRALIQTITFSLPTLFNVSALLILNYFIFAVLGVFLFGEVYEGDQINPWMNFNNFGKAIIMLFRCSTGEDWNRVMFDLSKTAPNCTEGVDCGSSYSYLYFISFNIICSLIMLNLFILVII